MILNDFLDNSGLRVALLRSLGVKGGSSSIEHFLLLVAEHVVLRSELPVVFSVLLLSRCKVSVSFSIKGMQFSLLIDEGTVSWEDHFLSRLQTLGSATEFHATSCGLFGPVVLPGVTLTERFSDVRGILIFFDIVKFVSHTVQILSLQDVTDMLGTVGSFTIDECAIELGSIIGMTPVLLNFTWLIDMGFPKLLQVLRSVWVLDVSIRSYVKVCVFSFPYTNNLMTSLPNSGNWISGDSYRLFEGSSKWDSCHL